MLAVHPLTVLQSRVLISSDDQHPALLSCWRRIEAQIISERQLPHLRPNSHHRALGLGLGDALAQVVPWSNVQYVRLTFEMGSTK